MKDAMRNIEVLTSKYICSVILHVIIHQPSQVSFTDPICNHVTLSFHSDLTSASGCYFRGLSPQQLFAPVTAVNPSRDAITLHPRGRINCIARDNANQ